MCVTALHVCVTALHVCERVCVTALRACDIFACECEGVCVHVTITIFSIQPIAKICGPKSCMQFKSPCGCLIQFTVLSRPSMSNFNCLNCGDIVKI